MEAFVIVLIVFFTVCISKINKFDQEKQIQLQTKINYEFFVFDSFVSRTRKILKTDSICCDQDEIDTLRAEIDEYLAKRP